jgi:hypothetical protein
MPSCMHQTKLKGFTARLAGESGIRNVARRLTFVLTQLILIVTENLLCLELVSKKQPNIEFVRHARACLFVTHLKT